MADINNSLALGIKNDAPDIGKTLLTVGQLREMQAKTSLEEAATDQTQQNVDYNAFQQSMPGNNGLRTTDANTAAETQQKKLQTAGQIGSILVNGQSNDDRRQAIDLAKTHGDVSPLMEAHIMNAPAAVVKQYGQNLQTAGTPPAATSEQDPNKQQQRGYGRASGEVAGQTGGPVPNIPGVKPMTQPQVDGAISSRTNANGSPRVLSLNGNVPDQPGAPVNPLAQKGVTEAQNAELRGNAEKNVEEFSSYKQAATNSSSTKNSLRQIIDDSDRAFTGPAGERVAAANRVLYTATKIPGIGPLIEHFIGDKSDPVAAIENIRKNVGIISRQAVGDIGERSAAALDNVTRSIPTEVTSQKGIRQAANQLMAVEDFKQARVIESTKWLKENGTLNGFAADWAQNMGPATFVMARLPKEDQIAVRKRMSATPEGQRSLDQIDRQIDWAKDHGLGKVID